MQPSLVRSRSSRARALAVAMGGLVLGSSTSAFAADAAAESLFQEAVGLMKKGSFAEACPKLEASQRREPRSGTLLNLASCREQEGKTATAWALYKDAATLARTENRPQNAAKATQLAAAVEARLSRLRVDLAAAAPQEEVAIDGATLGPGALGAAVPVDPGKHVVSASAPGHVAWSSEIVVDKDATVTVPSLVKIPEKSAPAAPVQPGDASAPTGAKPDSTQRVPTWAWVAGGAGVALVAASVVFRIDQSSAGSTLDEKCGDGRRLCGDTPGYDYDADRARETRDFAAFLGLGVAGLAGLGMATYGIVTAPHSSATARSTPYLAPVFSAGPSSANAGIRGAF